ncbi:MAG: RNA-binding protein [Bacteroidetes bacterium]|nr:MAG: RNA-binding protein [Bacteroidota bacterium]
MNIYVGNLPFATTDEDLKQLFTEYGEVQKARVIIDRESGRSRGFGFVEMSDNAARTAISKLNETEFDGKQISVNEARDKSNGTGTGGYGNRRRSW